ncbi:hypothetical protein TNCV_806531 [Trichonephila clavipes]|nr:hypothetical protein TNCV_806531 [Trichonephila clavipes]
MGEEQLWETWMLKRRVREITKKNRTDLREPRRGLSQARKELSVELHGIPRINENEGGLRTEKLRVSDRMVKIEQASTKELAVELPRSVVFCNEI